MIHETALHRVPVAPPGPAPHPPQEQRLPRAVSIIEEAELEQARNLAEAEAEITRLGLNRGAAEQARAAARITRTKVATVYRHLRAIQFIFENAADHGAGHHGRLKGVLWTTRQLKKLKAEENNNGRLAWGDKLAGLLGTKAFVDPQPAGEDVHAVFWPTLLGCHAGLRQE